MVFLLMILAAGGTLHAQVAAEMDALLETPAINFIQASRFVLASVDIDLADGYLASFNAARERGWLPKRANPDGHVTLGELCFLVMRAFGMKGSFLYALFPGPRYAFRELDYLRVIPGRRDPARQVSGEELLRLLDLVIAGEGVDWAAEMAAAAAPVPEPAVAAAPVPEPAVAAAPVPVPVPVPESAVASVPEAPVPVPVADLPASPPALPETAEAVVEEREQIAVVIRAEPEKREVADTGVRVEKEGSVISLNNIRFLPDSVELTAREIAKLQGIAAILLQHPGRNILVNGHTAMAGSWEGRRRISTERAQAVADFLVALNVRRAAEITVTGYGADRPLGDTATEEGKAMNRRVEIILLDRGQP
jgi:outer membrane protein OmpA-like peptidoglycan-associated protein